MPGYILPLETLIEQFEHLPGIGHKTAVRLAFSVLEGTEEEAQAFVKERKKLHPDARHTVFASLAADLTGFVMSVLCVRMLMN